VGSINGDTSGSHVNLLLEVGFVSSVDIHEARESGTNISGVEDAVSILGSVWVAALGVNSIVGNDVLHGLSHETSITSLVSLISRAIHKILLRQRDEFSFAEVVASLSGSSGGESPARTALLLVLNWSDCSKSVPVPLGRKSLHGRGMNDGLSVDSVSGSKEAGIFSSSEIGKFVESNGEGLVGSIVGIDEVQVRLEDSVSEKE